MSRLATAAEFCKIVALIAWFPVTLAAHKADEATSVDLRHGGAHQ